MGPLFAAYVALSALNFQFVTACQDGKLALFLFLFYYNYYYYYYYYYLAFVAFSGLLSILALTLHLA